MSKMLTKNLSDLITDNKEVFKAELTKVIKPNFSGVENPEKYKNILMNTIEQSKRSSLLRQAQLVAAGTKYLESKKNKSLIISAEMGSGKCILPNSNVIINGQIYTIEEAYEKFANKESVVVDDENPFAFWYQTNSSLSVPSYDESQRKMITKKIKHIYKQKVSETIRRVKTAGKYVLETTKVHKFLTPSGWTNNIKVGDYVAIPKNEKIIGKKQNIMNPQLLAWLLGEGYFGSTNTRLDGEKSGHYISFTQKDINIADKIYDMAIAESGYSVTRDFDSRTNVNIVRLYRVQKMLKYIEWGVSKDKEIPDFLMKSTKEDIVKFLAAYIDAEGSVSKDAKGTVEISTASKKMAYQLSSLLRKLNVVSTIEEMQKSATNGTKIKRTYYRVSIGGSSVRTLSKLIVPYSIVDYKKERLLNISKRNINNNIETIYMFDIIKELRELTGLSRAKSNNIFANVYLNGTQKTVNKKRAYEIIDLIDSVIAKDIKIVQNIQHDELNALKNEILLRISQKIFFVPVKEISEYQYDGYVYDLSVEDTHNFIAENMLVHNTDMAVKISLSKKLKPVYMIVCPPHLVQTWIEELEINYRNPNAYKVIRVKRWEDIAPYAKRNLWNDGVKYYFIITRSGLKLSYPKKPAVRIKPKKIIIDEQIDGEFVSVNKIIKTAQCPDCGATLLEGTESSINLDKIPRVCECGSILRQVDKSVSKKLQTREAIVDYIYKKFPKYSYNVIIDEVHEDKGGDTAQGNAMGRLVSGARKVIALTGTLMNGYASSLFYLLYRLNPKLMKEELGFDYNQVKDFVSTYGAHEQVLEAKEVSMEGVVTRMGRRVSIKEKPKISPHLLSTLLGMTIFLKLEEIKMPDNLQLPPYEEIVDLVNLEEDLRVPYISYLEEITKKIMFDKRLLGNLATDAIAIPDMPFEPRNAQNVCFYKPEYTREEFGLTNKEKRLIENVRGELEQGRDCLVFITFSNQQVATDLQDILTDAFPNKTVKFLPSSVLPAKRKEWIEKNPCDVLIANPELVKTGLTLLNFVTIIFYETTYNVFTLKQASRRSWRIGQKENIKVIFMAYADTPQHKALELIGAKIGAANSLEGKFSSGDDLADLSDDDNIQMALARSILGGESASKDIEMTSIQNFGADRDYNAFEIYYQSLLDDNSKLEQLKNEELALKAELIETATKNEEKEISIHDGHGGNWGSDLADLFGIASQSSNIEICSMPKTKTVEVQEKPCEDKFTLKNMINTFSKNLLEHHNSGDLYGGVKHTFTGYNGKKEVSTSTVGAYPIFNINEDYENGKLFGLRVSYNRDKDNQTVQVNVDKVYHNDKVPFQTECQAMSFDANVLKQILEESNNDVATLSKILAARFEANSITEKSLKRVTGKSTTQTQEDTQSFCYYVGKGKKQKKVEINAANNLFDVIPETELKSGVQLAFAF